MSSARPPDQPRRGAHARHAGPRDRAGVRDQASLPDQAGLRDQPRGGGSGRGQDGRGEPARRGPRHAKPSPDEPDHRPPGGQPAGRWAPGPRGPGHQAPGYGTLTADDDGHGGAGYAAGHGEPGYHAPALPDHAAPRHRPLSAGTELVAVSRHPDRLDAPRQPGPAGAPFRPVHPGSGLAGDRSDHGLPVRGRRDPTAAAGQVSQTRSHRRHAHPPSGGSRPDRRPAGPQDRSRPRRGRRTLIWLGTGLIVLAGAVLTVVLLRTGPGGPAHTLTTPARLGTYQRRPQLARQMGVAQLEKRIITQSSGQASHLVSAVYQHGSTVPGGPPPQTLLFIGGKLAGAPPDASIKSFDQHFRGAAPTSPGPLGGRAACVPGQPGTGGAAVCAWFDNDTFGELVSPHMTASALASELRAIRPSIERLSK